jgi:hypothetical protein
LILKSPPEIELSKQIRLIYLLCVLWNFIRKHETIGSLLEEIEQVQKEVGHSSSPSNTVYLPAVEDARMKAQHNRIATKMWDQYITYTGQSKS